MDGRDGREEVNIKIIMMLMRIVADDRRVGGNNKSKKVRRGRAAKMIKRKVMRR